MRHLLRLFTAPHRQKRKCIECGKKLGKESPGARCRVCVLIKQLADERDRTKKLLTQLRRQPPKT